MSHTDSFQFFGLFVVVHQHNRNFLILRFLMCDKMLKREKKTRLDGAAVAAVSTTGAHARAELEKDYAFLVTCDTFSLAVVLFDRTLFPSTINSLSHQKEATVSRQHYFLIEDLAHTIEFNHDILLISRRRRRLVMIHPKQLLTQSKRALCLRHGKYRVHAAYRSLIVLLYLNWTHDVVVGRTGMTIDECGASKREQELTQFTELWRLFYALCISREFFVGSFASFLPQPRGSVCTHIGHNFSYRISIQRTR